MSSIELWKAMRKLVYFSSFLWKGPVNWELVLESPQFYMWTPKSPSKKMLGLWSCLLLFEAFMAISTLSAVAYEMLSYNKKDTSESEAFLRLSQLQIILYFYFSITGVICPLRSLFLQLQHRHSLVAGSNALIKFHAFLASFARLFPKGRIQPIRKESVELFLIPVIVTAILGALLTGVVDLAPVIYWAKRFRIPMDGLALRFTVIFWRICSITILLCEACRSFILVLPTTILYLQQNVQCLQIISLLKRRFSITKKIKWIIKHNLIFYEAHDYYSRIFLMFMASGVIILILGNFVTIKMYRIIGMPFYLVFPFISTIAVIFGMLGVAAASSCYEKSVELKRNLVTELILDSGNMKLLERRLASMNPIKLSATIGSFNLFFCNRGTTGWYWYATLSYTINVLLSVQVE